MLPVRGKTRGYPPACYQLEGREEATLLHSLPPFFGVLGVVLAYLSPGSRDRGREERWRGEVERRGGEEGGKRGKNSMRTCLILQSSYARLPRECSPATRQRLCKAALRTNNEEDIIVVHRPCQTDTRIISPPWPRGTVEFTTWNHMTCVEVASRWNIHRTVFTCQL